MELANILSQYSSREVLLASSWLTTGDFNKSAIEAGYKKEAIYQLKRDKLASKHFLKLVQNLKEVQKNEVLIDKDMILIKLQKELIDSNGIASAKIAETLFKFLGFAERKEITVHIPEEVRDRYRHSVALGEAEEAKYIETHTSPASIEKNEIRVNKLIEEQEKEARARAAKPK